MTEAELDRRRKDKFEDNTTGSPPSKTKDEQDNAIQGNSGGDDTEHPPFKILLPAMAAIWLAFFVVALVGASSITNRHR
jgi:hypothetical protein